MGPSKMYIVGLIPLLQLRWVPGMPTLTLAEKSNGTEQNVHCGPHTAAAESGALMVIETTV